MNGIVLIIPYVMFIFIFFCFLFIIFKKASKPRIAKADQEKYKDRISTFKQYFRDFMNNEEYKNISKFKLFVCNNMPVSVMVLVVLFFLIMVLSGPLKLVAIGLMVASIITMIVCFATTANKITKIYKEQVIKKMLKDFYPGAVYLPDSGISERDYAFKKYVGVYDSYYIDDLITYKLSSGELVNFCNLETTRTDTDSDGDTTTVTTFEGIFGYVDMNIESNYDEIYVGTSFAVNNKKISMDNDDFKKRYSVRSENEVSAYKLLTPDTMERLLKLFSEGHRTDMLLINKRFYFRYHCGDLFTASIKEDRVVSSLLEYSKEIDFIKEFLENIKKYLLEKE